MCAVTADDNSPIATVVGFVFFAGVIAGSAYVLWYVLIGQHDPYWAEGRLGNYRQYHFEQRFPVRTLSGFHAQMQLRGTILKVDKVAFKAGRMADEANRIRLIEDFHRLVVAGVLRDFFVVFDWGTASHPFWWSAYHVEHAEGSGAKFALAPNNVAIRESIARACGDSWVRDGCRVEVMLVDFGLWDQRLIEENYQMLTKEDLQLIGLDPVYLGVIERAVVAAMKKVKTVEEAREDEIRELATQLASRPPRPPDIDPVEDAVKRVKEAYRRTVRTEAAKHEALRDAQAIFEKQLNMSGLELERLMSRMKAELSSLK